MLCIIPPRQPPTACVQKGGSRTLHCPLERASCLTVEVEMSNVRSLPPCVPPGGQASDFPFRKGHRERPSRLMAGERKEEPYVVRAGTLALHHCPSGPASSPPDVYSLNLHPSTHSLTSAPPNTALCSVLGYDPWGTNSMRRRHGYYTKNPTNGS